MTQKLIAYKRMPIWTKDTMPEALQRKHNTKVGTWGKITVLKGQLRFIELTEEGEEIASTSLKQEQMQLSSIQHTDTLQGFFVKSLKSVPISQTVH